MSPVRMVTDATCEIEILSSLEPINRGLMRDTRWGVISIRSGNQKFPAVQRLALKTYCSCDIIHGALQPLLVTEPGRFSRAQTRGDQAVPLCSFRRKRFSAETRKSRGQRPQACCYHPRCGQH